MTVQKLHCLKKLKIQLLQEPTTTADEMTDRISAIV